MRSVLTFLAPRLLRALIAVWLVSTVVFVVMRLSGDPVPLLLPPDAPRSEIFRVRRELVGQSAPTFFLGILFILLLSLKADLFPTGGRGDWKHLVLPALTLGAFAMASIARLTRSAVLEVLRADYIRTARAKGVAEWIVVAKHTLKNAALPIVTITGLQFGTLLGGAVVTETVFAWPGIGRLAIQSIYNRDYPVVQCAVFLSAIVFIMINLAIDLLYGVLDPRARR